MDGYILRAIRDFHGLTQEGLAKRTGISESTIAQLEVNNRKPSAKVRYRLAQHFPITPEIMEAAKKAREADRLLGD